MSRRILAITRPDDGHAAALEHALGAEGGELTWLCSSDFPAQDVHCAHLQSDSGTIRVTCSAGARLHAYDAVWLRRVPMLTAPAYLHNADRELCLREGERFLWSMLKVLEPQAMWVNPIHGYLTCRHSKLLQLVQARNVGLKVPETLASNDPARVAEFHAAHGGRVIAKPFFPQAWRGDDGTVYNFMTTFVTPEVIASAQSVRASPLIYQPYIEKKFELRVQCIGGSSFTTRIDSQACAESRVDWRIAQGSIPLAYIDTPAELHVACQKLMRALGIIMGAFDFIQTPEDEHVFLEVNESGQFLWAEYRIPEMPLLDALVELMLSGDPGHVYSGRAPRHSFRQYATGQAYKDFVARCAGSHCPVDTSYYVAREPDPGSLHG